MKNIKSKCIACQYYDRQNDACRIKSQAEFANQDQSNCTDYLINERLVMF